MASLNSTLDVVYEGRRKKQLLKSERFVAFKDDIRRSFGIIGQFHLVAYKNNGLDYDIQDDNDVATLLTGDSRLLGIVAYQGGPCTIWLGREEHSITRVPAANTHLMRLAREVVLPDFKKTEFVENLRKLLNSIKLAKYRLYVTNTGLSTDLSNMVSDDLKPALGRCRETFQTVVEKNRIVLDKITVVITHLRDGLEEFVEPHLRDIATHAAMMEEESGERVKELENVEGKVREILRRVQEVIGGGEEIVRYLEETVCAIRKVQSVMSDMKSFWSNVKAAICSLSSSTFLADIKESVGTAEGQTDEETHKRSARHMWRTKAFKLTGIAFISKHAAIRDICLDCQDPMRTFQRDLVEFLEENIPDSGAAQQKYQDMIRVVENPAREENVDNDETIAEVREVLGLPYDNTVMRMTQARHESGYADLRFSSEADLEENENALDEIFPFLTLQQIE
ncbi:uncharacterized protein LOC135499693 [Lineus longissimus]|uniref:uncharacterized protein LOC135499693 n=1 Tax=Lineus longissimus TaxID=88925 RepID=UPI00315CC85C